MKKKPLVITATELWHELAKDHPKPFDSKKARIFALSANGFTRVLVEAGDIYEALETASKKTLVKGEIGIGCETVGWAAPVATDDNDDNDDDVAPSQHPKRRRVRLICLVNTSLEAGSALGFSGDDEIITDEGTARGSLADALMKAMLGLVAKNN